MSRRYNGSAFKYASGISVGARAWVYITCVCMHVRIYPINERVKRWKIQECLLISTLVLAYLA